MQETQKYPAILQKVFPHGRHGPYAKARSETLGTVTFSLDQPVWQEEGRPQEGMWVVMEDIRKKRAGWRAEKCRFMRPEDTTEATSTTDKRNTDNG